MDLAENYSWKFAFHFFITKIMRLMTSRQVCHKILAVKKEVFCTSFLMWLSKQHPSFTEIQFNFKLEEYIVV